MTVFLTMVFLSKIRIFLIRRGLKPLLVQIQAGDLTANVIDKRTKCMNTGETWWTESGSICWETVTDWQNDQGR